MAAKHVRIGTFNLLNHARPDFLVYGKKAYSPAVYQQKCDWIATQLLKMNADIVGFQELWQIEALEDVLATAPLNGSKLYPTAPHLLISGSHQDGPRVAILSKYPIQSHRIIQQFPAASQLSTPDLAIPYDSFSRPVLVAQVAVTDSLSCSILVTHLKSKRPDFAKQASAQQPGVDLDKSDPLEQAKGQARSLLRRAAEATALRAIVLETLHQTQQPVIVLGDLNDNATAVSSQLIAGEPPYRFLPKDKRLQKWAELLHNTKDIQSRLSYGDFYYSHIYNGRYEALDHILVSNHFFSQNPDRLGRVGMVSLFNDHLLDETLASSAIPKWQSDHGQVVAEIELD
jgi:endonuclease/exonuclease/phosphatase family metal-dependent hydrolase